MIPASLFYAPERFSKQATGHRTQAAWRSRIPDLIGNDTALPPDVFRSLAEAKRLREIMGLHLIVTERRMGISRIWTPNGLGCYPRQKYARARWPVGRVVGFVCRF